MVNIVLSWWWIWTCASGLLKWLLWYINYFFCLLGISTVHVLFKLQIVCKVCTICLDCALEVIPSWFQDTAGKDSTCVSVPLWYHYNLCTPIFPSIVSEHFSHDWTQFILIKWRIDQFDICHCLFCTILIFVVTSDFWLLFEWY